MKLARQVYNKFTLRVAQQLLGKFLIRKIGNKKIIGKVVETEAYVGFQDKASHASRGFTKRTAIMYGPPGVAYVYMIYGMYYCLNIVTQRIDYPAAVLIRAVEPVYPRRGQGTSATNFKKSKPSGPGKVCQYFKIDKRLNGVDLSGPRLWLEDRGDKIANKDIIKAKRVGVDYAGPYKHKLWRFYLRNNSFVSKR